MDELKETQPKKKGTSKSKKQNEDVVIENGDAIKETNSVEEAQKPEPKVEEETSTDAKVEEAKVDKNEEPKVEEAPADSKVEEAKADKKEEPKVEEAPKPEQVKPDEVQKTDIEKEDKKEKSARKSVPSTSELRKMRKFNESIFRFDDGFACTATSTRIAESKHKKWLDGE